MLQKVIKMEAQNNIWWFQVVRADVKDLNNEELDGAPYGFVPFCESRKEIEGFR